MTKTHMRHAGKCGDVFKHFALAELLNHYACSCPETHPILYIDSHAGRGLYNIQRCSDRAVFEIPVNAMPHAFRRVARHTFPPFYPGSPVLADRLLRGGDYMVLSETNAAELELLGKYLDRKTYDPDVTAVWFQHENGYPALRRVLGLYRKEDLTSILFLDPTYDDPADWEQVAEAAWIASELRPPTLHTTVVWYPVLEGQRAKIDILHRRLAQVAHAEGGTLLHQEIKVGQEPGSDMVGAGMFFVKVMPGTQQALQRAIVAGNGIYDLTAGNIFTGPRA